MPLLAIRPTASAVSSAEKPSAPATGATYLNVSPIIFTFVLALLEACAKRSAKCSLSEADSPKAVNESVTISEVIPKSSPEAAARFMIPSRPSSISLVSHPAMAMYFSASADSPAENFVVFPISSALSRSAARSSPVAPEIAPTSDIAASKSAAVLIAFVPRATRGVVTPNVIFLPVEDILSPNFSILSPAFSIPLPNLVMKSSAACSTFCMLFSAASVSMNIDPNSLNSSIYVTRLSLSHPSGSPPQTFRPHLHAPHAPGAALP